MLVLKIFFLTVLCVYVADCNKTSHDPKSASAQKRSSDIQKSALTNTTTPEAAGGVFDATEIPTTTEVTTTELTTTVGTCESNDTECIAVNGTRTSPVNNDTGANETINEKNSKLARSTIDVDTNICTCNLQVDFCDINCCCDPDCSPNDKSIFGYCEMVNRYYDTRYCNYIKYIYVNNTPLQWEVNQDGLFCIITSNLPETYLIQKEEPINSIENAQPVKNFWSQENNFLENDFQFRSKNYVYGDTIMIIRDDSSMDNFRLAKNFLTSRCIFEEDVFYLNDIKNTCSQMTFDDGNAKLNFNSFFKRFKVIGSPKLFNTTKFKNDIYRNCPRNVCLDIEPKLCNTHFTNCSSIEENRNITFHCSYDFKKNLNSCQHALEKIHYKFYHNGTKGLLKIEALGVLKNFSYHFGRSDFEFFQEFSLDFMWIDKIKNYSRILSGNPGYITGKPILVGTKMTDGNTGTFIKRNSTSFLENFLVFPANVEGMCVKNDTYYIPMEFQYNMIAKCELRKELTFRNKQNATDICRGIQRNIFDLWGVKKEANNSFVFGFFGNANASNLHDWGPILYRVHPTEFLNFTQGIFIDKNKTLMCQNISTLLNIDVLYSRIDLKTVLNQNKILGVVFSFQNVLNPSFSLMWEQNISRLDLSLGLVNRVSFYDITGDKAKKFVDPPSFDIRLPYDFFYPFIRVGNGINLVRPNIVAIFVCLHLLKCLF